MWTTSRFINADVHLSGKVVRVIAKVAVRGAGNFASIFPLRYKEGVNRALQVAVMYVPRQKPALRTFQQSSTSHKITIDFNLR